jgi:putative transposase
MKTYSFKLYTSTKNRHLHQQINLASEIYNYCIALHKRYYKLFFGNLKAGVRTAPPSFKKQRKYRSFSLKQTGYKLLEGNKIRMGKRVYKYFKSKEIDGNIKLLTVKRDPLGDVYLFFVTSRKQRVTVVFTDRFEPTSKTCSRCGYVNNELTLSMRSWLCPECETNHHRDRNASYNILRVGASTLRLGDVRPTQLAISVCPQNLTTYEV